LTNPIKHIDVSGTSELLSMHFQWYGTNAQFAALFASIHVHHTFTLPTCFKWYFLSSLMCAFSSTVHFLPLSVCCWRLSTSLRHGQTSVGEGEE